jgi:hypothetical protein
MRETPKNPSEFQWLPPLQGDPRAQSRCLEKKLHELGTPHSKSLSDKQAHAKTFGAEAELTISATLDSRH